VVSRVSGGVGGSSSLVGWIKLYPHTIGSLHQFDMDNVFRAKSEAFSKSS
jgi:hypothetical protein